MWAGCVHSPLTTCTITFLATQVLRSPPWVKGRKRAKGRKYCQMVFSLKRWNSTWKTLSSQRMLNDGQLVNLNSAPPASFHHQGRGLEVANKALCAYVHPHQNHSLICLCMWNPLLPTMCETLLLHVNSVTGSLPSRSWRSPLGKAYHHASAGHPHSPIRGGLRVTHPCPHCQAAPALSETGS